MANTHLLPAGTSKNVMELLQKVQLLYRFPDISLSLPNLLQTGSTRAPRGEQQSVYRTESPWKACSGLQSGALLTFLAPGSRRTKCWELTWGRRAH